MRKMSMVPQKNQFNLPEFVTFNTVGTSTFNRTAYSMAGYQNIDIMVIGGAGGRAARARVGTAHTYPCGGGGGSMMIYRGKLSSLPVSSPVVVGAPGTSGAEATSYNVYAGNGGPGGESSVAGFLKAPGGLGGVGGRIVTGGSVNPPGRGGDGGYYPGYNSPVRGGGYGGDPDALPESGSYYDTLGTLKHVLSPDWIITHMTTGGGGGVGSLRDGSGNYILRYGQEGGVGAETDMFWAAPGEPKALETLQGSHGGGVNAAAFAAGNWSVDSSYVYYGSNGAQSGADRFAQGLVVMYIY